MRSGTLLPARVRAIIRPLVSRVAARSPELRRIAAVTTLTLVALAGASEAAVALGWAPNALAPSAVARRLARGATPEETVVWGPRRFETPSGAAQTYVEQIPLAPVPGKLYHLKLRRSGQLTTATVMFNGVRIVEAIDLEATDEVTLVITPTASDVLSITVAGEAGAALTVSELETGDPTFLVFGPAQYTRTPGSPDRFQVHFPLPATAAGPHRMCIQNGTDNGDDRLSSARIWVNGVEALRTRDLNQKVAGLVRDVELQAENVVDIELRSSPGSYLTLCFTATDVTPPMVEVTAPAAGAIVGAAHATVTGTVQDETATRVTVNGVAASVTNGVFTATVPLPLEGANVVTVIATDAPGLTTTATRTVIRDTEAPVVSWSAPAEGLTTKTAAAVVSGTVLDRTTVTVNVNGVILPVDGTGAFTGEVALVEGPNFLTLAATDGVGHTTALARQVTLDTQAPTLAVTEPADGAVTEATSVTVRGTAADATALSVTVNGNAITVGAGGGFSADVALAEGPNSIGVAATDAAGNSSTETRTVTRRTAPPAGGMSEVLPVDLAISAPVLTQTVPTSVGAASSFLYAGDSPVQTGVAEGTIEPARASVVRGRVLTRDGQVLAGVEVTIAEHAEFGQTTTRANGQFDMAVNAGPLRVSFEKEGFLPAQRLVEVPRQEFTVLDDVVLLTLDPVVTTVDFSEPVEVARGSVMSDADGTRQATMLFREGTQAVMELPDGTTQPLSTLSVRATEYTVGPNGAKAMPGGLPPTSAYTYAAELSVDEAMAAGATGVRFNQPVPFYVENFLGIPVGTAVPVGYYDRVHCGWVAAKNGRVIKILSIDGGLAQLDVDGSGAAASAGALAALEISDAERERLAQLYPAGQELWRAALTHFSPVDLNFPAGPEKEKPNVPQEKDETPPCQTKKTGSIIECESQTLGETIEVSGTPLVLNYSSERTRGRAQSSTVNVRLTGSSALSGIDHIQLTIAVAGRVFTRTFAPEADLVHPFTWDGLDAYGRRLNGAQPMSITIDYVGAASYGVPAAGDRSFGVPGTGEPLAGRARDANRGRRAFHTTIGPLDQRGQGLGGWSLTPHHAFDPERRTLYLGSGERRTASALGMIGTLFGKYVLQPEGYHDQIEGTDDRLAIGIDGSMYFVRENTVCVRKRDPQGVVTTVAGICELVWFGTHENTGDGGPATEARLAYPEALAVAPDGTLYIGTLLGGVRRVGTDGIITTVPGTSHWYTIQDMEVAPDCALYVLANEYYFDSVGDEEAVHRIAPDGTITKIAGSGRGDFTGEGPATETPLGSPNGIGLGPDGDVYITNWEDQVLRVGRDGVIRAVVGRAQANGYDGDGGPAIAAALSAPYDVAIGRDGTMYIADFLNNAIRKVGTDGIITTLAGAQVSGHWLLGHGDGGPPQGALLHLPEVVLVGPDGGVYFAEAGRIRRIEREMPKAPGEAFVIGSPDGSEIFYFGADGRHLRTVDALTGASLHQFAYDAAGLLVSILDGDGLVTHIERDAAGLPTAIIGPHGHRTSLTLDAGGMLASVTDAAQRSTELTYSPGGLLMTLRDVAGRTRRYGYDEQGLLVRDEDGLGGFTSLNRQATAGGQQVTVATAGGQGLTLDVERTSIDGSRRISTDARGLRTISESRPEGVSTLTTPDGMVLETTAGPNERFGIQAAVPKSLTIRTPSGLTTTLGGGQRVTLADAANPLSVVTQMDSILVNGRVIRRTFDAPSRTVTQQSAEGRTVTTRVDGLRRPLESRVPGFAPIAFTYDAQGRLAETTHDGRSTALAYDDRSRLSVLTDPLHRETRFFYDAADRLSRQVLPGGREVGYSYDAAGNLVSITPPGRPAHRFEYDAAGLLREYAPPVVGAAAAVTRFSYDTDRRLTHILRPDGSGIALGYDGGGRPTTVGLARGTVRRTYSGTTGLVERITAPDGGAMAYAYDGALPAGIAWTGTVTGSVAFSFNNDLRLASTRVNGGHDVAFTYDGDGLLTLAGALALQRDPTNGTITGTTLGGITTSYAYTPTAEVATVNVRAGSGVLFAQHYTRDALGRVTEIVETLDGVSTTHGYGYDEAGRVATVRHDGSPVASYEYDANGNRRSITSPNGTLTGVYDVQDRLVTHGDASYSHRASGELTQKTISNSTTAYEYDELGNLLSVTLPNGQRIEYVVDGQNRRIGRRVDGVVTQGWLYEGPVTISAELNGQGTVVSRFVYATYPHVPEYMVRAGKTYQLVLDHLGSVRLVVDVETGEVAQRLDYDAYGQVTRNTNPGFQPFGFAGGLYDHGTGLVRFGARDYDAETGRWTAKDPMSFSGGNGNLYSYVANDPINNSDPLGLWTTAQYLAHYFFGGGKTVNLWDVGDMGKVQKHSQKVTDAWKKAAIQAAHATALKTPFGTTLINEHKTSMKNIDYQSVVFVLGNSNLLMRYSFKIELDWTTCMYSFRGSVAYTINDMFVDALDIKDQWKGNQEAPRGRPYPIVGTWFDDFSGSGTLQ